MPIVLQVVLVLWLVASPVVALVIGVGIARADRIAKIRNAASADAYLERGAPAAESDDALGAAPSGPGQSATQRHPETVRLGLVVTQRDGVPLNG